MSRLRPQRLSLRARITAMFVLTVAGVGLALIGLVYAYLKLTPVPFQAGFGPGEDAPVIDAAIPVTDEILHVVLTTSLGVLALLTALAGALGWLVAGRVLAPLSAIADDARAVTSGALDSGAVTARIDYDGPADEVGQLAAALNAMLDSLAAAIASQRRFAANASHELKTPIATIQTMSDVALADPAADSGDLRRALTRVREVNAGSAATVASLLSLADVQSGRPLALRRVDLSGICRRVAREHGLDESRIEPGVFVEADAGLVHTAVDNLARNALDHGEPGTATLQLAAGAPAAGAGSHTRSGTAEVIVRNAGAVWDEGDVEKLKEPFAASRTSKGNGLGLALVSAIAKAHGAELALAPRDGGGLEAAVRFAPNPAGYSG